MYQTFKQIIPKRKLKKLRDGIKAVSINFGNGSQPAQISFSDGKSSVGSCIHCINPACMEYIDDELKINTFPDFPSDLNKQVCPTDAIDWAQEQSAPTIDEAKCISCGLCVARCPVSAISLNDKAVPTVNDKANEYFINVDGETNEKIVNEIIERFSAANVTGILLKENDEFVSRVFSQIYKVMPNLDMQFPNLLSRNLLIASGIGTAMRRRGDTNIRMDLVLGEPGVKYGTGEVEFGQAVIDAPRNILDNIAILISRYKLKKEEIFPLIVSLSLPNQRSEYWQVIKDIESVVGIKLSSITIGILILMVWNRQTIDFTNGGELYADTGSYSIKDKIEKILGRKIDDLTGYPGFLQSVK